MALNNDYKKEYLGKLKNSIDAFAKSNKYDSLCEKKNKLKTLITESLNDKDLFYDFDSAKFINKSTNEIINEEIELDLYTKLKFLEYTKISFEIDEFEWSNKFNKSVNLILIFGEQSKLENEIINEFGSKVGKDIIMSLKRELVEYEKQLGVEYITNEVYEYDKLINKIDNLKTLKFKTNIDLTIDDNIVEEDVIVIDKRGLVLNFTKTSLIHYNDNIYINFRFKVDFEDYEYYLYKVLDEELVLEENDNIIDLVYEIEERLIALNQINKK